MRQVALAAKPNSTQRDFGEMSVPPPQSVEFSGPDILISFPRSVALSRTVSEGPPTHETLIDASKFFGTTNSGSVTFVVPVPRKSAMCCAPGRKLTAVGRPTFGPGADVAFLAFGAVLGMGAVGAMVTEGVVAGAPRFWSTIRPPANTAPMHAAAAAAPIAR